jgi:hypothetical protein
LPAAITRTTATGAQWSTAASPFDAMAQSSPLVAMTYFT